MWLGSEVSRGVFRLAGVPVRGGKAREGQGEHRPHLHPHGVERKCAAEAYMAAYNVARLNYYSGWGPATEQVANNGLVAA